MIDTKTMKYIGSFSVDSGQAMIGDPWYLDNWEDWNGEPGDEPFNSYETKAGEYGYLGACGVTLKQGYGELGNSSSVVFTTGYGDGLYPVYAEFNDGGRVARIVVDFIGDEE